MRPQQAGALIAAEIGNEGVGDAAPLTILGAARSTVNCADGLFLPLVGDLEILLSQCSDGLAFPVAHDYVYLDYVLRGRARSLVAYKTACQSQFLFRHLLRYSNAGKYHEEEHDRYNTTHESRIFLFRFGNYNG